MFKAFVVIVLLLILYSLGSALIYLLKERGGSERTAKALTIRIGLSIGLFILLLAAFRFGLIQPHGLRPVATTDGKSAPEGPRSR